MNILYIGPYRQLDDNGILSKMYLQNLIASGHNITSRPIYINLSSIESSANNFLVNETNLYDSYDIIIQHAPIKLLHSYSKYKKNIAIPIFDRHKNLRDYELTRLKNFDTILLDNHYDESILAKTSLSKKIKTITCPIMKDLAKDASGQKINLGIHNKSIKYYTFVDINKDADLINKILISFYTAFRCNYGKSIIVFIEGASQQQQNQLAQSIKDIKKQMKIQERKSVCDFFIFKNFSFEEKIIIHNTCDIFLNFSNGRRSIMQEEYAKFFNNSIINIENTETVDIPVFSADGPHIEDIQESILTKSMIEQIKKASEVKPKSTKHNQSFHNTLSTAIS